MRGLYACIQIPSPLASNGGGQAAFQYLETLTSHVEVDVVTFVGPGREPWLAPLREIVGEVLAVPWRPSYAMRLARWFGASLRSGAWTPFLNRPFLDAVHARLASRTYDFVQVDWTEVAAHVRVPPGVRFLCGAHDVREKLAARIFEQTPSTRARRRWERARREEEELFRRADAVLTLSESDARRVRELAPEAQVFPLVYRYASVEPPPPPWRMREPGMVLYVGDYSRRPNLEVVDHLLSHALPRLRARRPDVRLVLAGDGADPKLRRRAERAGAEVTGYLPRLDDVYRRASLLLAPIPIGGGVHIKMIEAMAAGLPVLTSPAGNDGIAGEAERSILVAATEEEIVEQASRILADPSHAERIGNAGRAHVLRHFGEERARERLQVLLASDVFVVRDQ